MIFLEVRQSRSKMSVESLEGFLVLEATRLGCPHSNPHLARTSQKAQVEPRSYHTCLTKIQHLLYFET